MTRSGFAVALLGLAAACSDATPPTVPPALPSFVAADLAGFDSIFYGPPAIYSFTGRFFTNSGPYYVPPAGVAATTPRLFGLFADSILGKSFVFDCVPFHYVRDDSLHDAAPDGIRIALYWEDDSHAPICPLSPVGYYDARDVGSVSSPALNVVVTSLNGDTTFVSESLTASVSGEHYRLTTNGFQSDGVRRFDLAGTSTGVDSMNADTLTLTRVVSGVRLSLSYRWIRTDAEIDLFTDLQLTHGQETVRLTGTQVFSAATTGDLVLSVNGNPFGTITRVDDSVAVRGPGGRDVTPEERNVMDWLKSTAFYLPYFLVEASHSLADLLGFRTYQH
jgi:hypothetical protein